MDTFTAESAAAYVQTLDGPSRAALLAALQDARTEELEHTVITRIREMTAALGNGTECVAVLFTARDDANGDYLSAWGRVYWAGGTTTEGVNFGISDELIYLYGWINIDGALVVDPRDGAFEYSSDRGDADAYLAALTEQAKSD